MKIPLHFFQNVTHNSFQLKDGEIFDNFLLLQGKGGEQSPSVPADTLTRPRVRRHLKGSRSVCRRQEHDFILRSAQSFSSTSINCSLCPNTYKEAFEPHNEDATCPYHLSPALLDRRSCWMESRSLEHVMPFFFL